MLGRPDFLIARLPASIRDISADHGVAAKLHSQMTGKITKLLRPLIIFLVIAVCRQWMRARCCKWRAPPIAHIVINFARLTICL